MTTEEAALKAGVSTRTARRWALEVRLPRKLNKQGIYEYVWTVFDIDAFKNRPRHVNQYPRR